MIGQTLEKSASEQVYSASQRIYHDLPVAKLLESDPKTQSVFVTSTETVTAVLTNIAKIGAFISLPVGIVLLNSYLRDEGAPLPAADTSISVLLSLVCVIFLFTTLILTSVFLLPTFAKISNPAKPEAPSDLFQHNKNKSTALQKIKQIAREYYLRFGPFLSFLLFVFVGASLLEKRGFQWIGATVGIVSFISYCWIWYVTRHPKFDDVLQSSARSLISFGTLFSLLIAVAQQVDPHMHTWKAVLFCVGVLLIVHALMVTLITDWKMALAFYTVIVMVLSIVWPGLSDLGGSLSDTSALAAISLSQSE